MVSVWTGPGMIIHGIGFGKPGVTFAYRPSRSRWAKLRPGPKSLTLEADDIAVWTGSRMPVIGLTNGSYDPATNTWRPIARLPLPDEPAVVGWTGHQAIVWGGVCCSTISHDGAAYDPASSTWQKLPTAPLKPRRSAMGTWTGKVLVVADGFTFGQRGTFRYLPDRGSLQSGDPQVAGLSPARGTGRRDRAVGRQRDLVHRRRGAGDGLASRAWPGLQPRNQPLAVAARDGIHSPGIRSCLDRLPDSRLGRADRKLQPPEYSATRRGLQPGHQHVDRPACLTAARPGPPRRCVDRPPDDRLGLVPPVTTRPRRTSPTAQRTRRDRPGHARTCGRRESLSAVAGHRQRSDGRHRRPRRAAAMAPGTRSRPSCPGSREWSGAGQGGYVLSGTGACPVLLTRSGPTSHASRNRRHPLSARKEVSP